MSQRGRVGQTAYRARATVPSPRVTTVRDEVCVDQSPFDWHL
jgi:hypothetical protein